MLPKINPTQTTAWKELQQHYDEMTNVHMRELFKNDNDRFSKYSIDAGDIVFDYSKNIINDRTIQLLLKLADECNLKQSIEAMFGDIFFIFCFFQNPFSCCMCIGHSLLCSKRF